MTPALTFYDVVVSVHVMAIIVALLVSGLVSYPLARRQRNAIVQEMRRKP